MNVARNQLHRIAEKITQLFALDSTWRLIDAYTPRVFGLVLQAFLIAEFGAEAYALPGWVLGTFGLILAFLPDPHSYILVRANGVRAQALYALTVPTLLFKILVAVGVVIVCLATTSAQQVAAPHKQFWHIVALSALFYGSTEFLWAILGTISLANGKTRRNAQAGIFARFIAIGLVFTAWKIGGVGIASILVLATLPVFVMWGVLSPLSMRWRRVRFFFVHGFIRYAGWLQGIAIITGALFQLPTIVLGVWPGADPLLVGIIAFTSRLLMAGLQPFQILQSVVIRDVSILHKRGGSLGRTPLWIVFKSGGIGFLTLALAGLGFMWSSGRIESYALVLSAALSAGVATSIWYRHELAVALVTSSARKIFLMGYAPTFALTMFATPLLMKLLGVDGLALAVIGGWVALSNSWRWVG